MIITLEELQTDLNSIGVQTMDGWDWRSNRFESPKLEWLETIFAEAVFLDMDAEMVNHYELEKNMCGHFSDWVRSLARRMWVRTMTPVGHPACGINVGSFNYCKGGVTTAAHSINFANIDHTIYFFEPQIWARFGKTQSARVNLTDDELGSCFGGQV